MSWNPNRKQEPAKPAEKFTPSPWEHLRFEVYKRDGFRCVYCGWTRPQDPTEDPDNRLEIDHIKPRAEGGRDELTNLVTSCKSCNAGKWYISLMDFLPPLDKWLIKRTRVKRRLAKLLKDYEDASAELAEIESPHFKALQRFRRITNKKHDDLD